jgi:hypothetical protein
VVNRSVVTKGPIMRCYLPLVVAPANYVSSLDPYGPPFGPLKPLIRRWGRWASFTANLHCEPQAVASHSFLGVSLCASKFCFRRRSLRRRHTHRRANYLGN